MNGFDDAHAGIANQDVEAAEGARRCFDESDGGCFLADIAGQVLQSIVVKGLKVVQFRRRFFVEVDGDNSGCIALEIFAGDGEPYAGCCSGNDGDFACKGDLQTVYQPFKGSQASDVTLPSGDYKL